jgi:hypothetical protein
MTQHLEVVKQVLESARARCGAVVGAILLRRVRVPG